MADEIEKKQNADLGKVLIDAAREQYRKERQDRVLAGVRRYMDLRAEALKKLMFLGASVDWYNKKLNAIEAGEFTFDETDGDLRFTDPDLNRANY